MESSGNINNWCTDNQENDFNLITSSYQRLYKDEFSWVLNNYLL